MDRVYMGMGLYGGEKIKRLTREKRSSWVRGILRGLRGVLSQNTPLSP